VDGRGYTTTTNYDASHLFPASVQLPTTGSVQHISYYTYDLFSSHLTSHVDENGSGPTDAAHMTSFQYDNMNRITSIQYPDGGGSAFCYTDSSTTCTIGGVQRTGPHYSLFTNTTSTPDPSVVTVHSYDGWGRQYQSKVLSDPLGATEVDTAYDFD